MRIGLRFKVTVLILLLITIVIGSLGYFFLRQQNIELREQVTSQAGREARSLAFFSARAILEQDDLSIADSLQNLQHLKGFVYGTVVSYTTGAPITQIYAEAYREQSEELGKLWPQKRKDIWQRFDSQRPAEIIREQMPLPPENNYQLDTYFLPIYHPFITPNPPLLGMVEISFSDEFIQRIIRQNTVNLLIAAGIFWIIGILGAFILSTYIVKPVRILSQGAAIVGEGNLDHKVPDLGKDELGQLASQFNTMTRGLKDAQEQREEQLVINEQIRQATEIQEGMNPKKFLNREKFQVKGFTRAAKGVGGDYYDFQILQDGRLALLISDVSGKSISASLVMVLIKTVVSTYLRLFNSIRPDTIITTINKVMCAEAHIDKFATILFTIFNPENRELIFTNGGHGPVFLYRAKDKVCTVSKLEGLPMGIDDENSYGLSKLQLESGDIVVLYTDGITEAWDTQKNEWGISRLQQKIAEYSTLNAKEIVERIITEIDQFAEGAEQHDDMTLVILKVP